MPTVKRFELNSTQYSQNLTNVLGYAVKQRKGLVSDLAKIDIKKGESVEDFRHIGLIKTQGSKHFEITKLGEQYFNDFCGGIEKSWENIRGFVEKALAN